MDQERLKVWIRYITGGVWHICGNKTQEFPIRGGDGGVCLSLLLVAWLEWPHFLDKRFLWLPT